MKETEDYQPFGTEWKAEVTKWPKAMIVDRYAKSAIETQSLRTELSEKDERIKELEEALAAHELDREWVDVKERLPETSGLVLGCMKDTQDQYICFYKPSRKLFIVFGAGVDPISDMNVTHWMLLPEVPDPTYGEIPLPPSPIKDKAI